MPTNACVNVLDQCKSSYGCLHALTCIQTAPVRGLFYNFKVHVYALELVRIRFEFVVKVEQRFSLHCKNNLPIHLAIRISRLHFPILAWNSKMFTTRMIPKGPLQASPQLLLFEMVNCLGFRRLCTDCTLIITFECKLITFIKIFTIATGSLPPRTIFSIFVLI